MTRSRHSTVPVRLLAAWFFSFAPAIASAEGIGTVTAAFDGGEGRTFYAGMTDGESQSFWVQVMPGSITGTGFSIWANPTEDANATEDVLIIGGSVARGPSGVLLAGEAQYLEAFF